MIDWEHVRERYASGAQVPMVGNKSLEVTEVSDDALSIRTSLWSDQIARDDLESAVALISDGELPAHALPNTERPQSFAEEYRRRVSDVRASSVAFILRDLGYLK